MSSCIPTAAELLTDLQTSQTHTPREWLAQRGRLLATSIAREYPVEVEPTNDRLIELILSRTDDTTDLVGEIVEQLTPAALAQTVLANPAALALVAAALPPEAVFGEAARRGRIYLEQPDEQPEPVEAPVPSAVSLRETLKKLNPTGPHPLAPPLAQTFGRLLERCRVLIDDATKEWIGGETGESRWLLDRKVTATEIAHLQHDLDVAIRATKETS